MNIIDENLTLNNKKKVNFAPTPLISTYLVAFSVGYFEYIEVSVEIKDLTKILTKKT